jgi:tRNA pseudouridine(55) synthase
MSDRVIIVDKKSGQTPLDCVNQVKNEHPEWKHLPMTYAGRLDPLASGILLILVGDECLKKDEYLALPKEYEVTVLFGFATDTYDVLGKITKTLVDASSAEVFERSSDLLAQDSLNERGQTISNTSADSASIQTAIKKFVGRIKQAYPPYSSRTVDGKPLFQWAREDKLDEITIPAHDVFVESIDIIDSNYISGNELYSYVKNVISNVAGDFRQTEILGIWAEKLNEKTNSQYKTITLRISCGSGVYVRSIVNELGVALGLPALALKIVRTKVGKYTLE